MDKDATTPPETPLETPNPQPPVPASAPEKEVGGRSGLDPVRYGDWEKGGIAVDF